ncbi:MAG: TIGR03936 family radical SAM-associated protein, partial [Blastocatellia bacterium]
DLVAMGPGTVNTDLVQLTAPARSAKPQPPKSNQPAEQMYRYRVSYAKMGPIKYLSHLDLTRALPRAFRRAKIRLGYSQGFHPMPLIQYGPALGVGCEGQNEVMEFQSPERLNEPSFLKGINQVLPEGMIFRSLESVAEGAPSLIKTINRAEWIISLGVPEIRIAISRLPNNNAAEVSARPLHTSLAQEFLALDSFTVNRSHKGRIQTVDVRRYTVSVEPDFKSDSLRFVTEITPNGGAKPVEVLAAIYGLTDDEKLTLNSRVVRTRVYFDSEPAVPSCIGGEQVAGPAVARI